MEIQILCSVKKLVNEVLKSTASIFYSASDIGKQSVPISCLFTSHLVDKVIINQLSATNFYYILITNQSYYYNLSTSWVVTLHEVVFGTLYVEKCNFLSTTSAARQLGYLRYGTVIMDAVDSTTLEKLEKAFEKLQNSDSKSLLKKYLTAEVFESLKTKKTSYGSTLLDCIQSGIQNLDSGVGVYAADPEAYKVFADLFDPIIEDYHAGFKKNDCHPPSHFGDAKDFGTLDPEGKLIISTRIRVGRSIDGYPFNPCMEENHYNELEQKARQVFSSLGDDLSGEFYPLTNMSKEVQQRLIDDHFLFKEGDRFLEAAKANHFWPKGRGIYHNAAKTFLVWVNEEDHLRVISMQQGGNVFEIFDRLVRGLKAIEKQLNFAHDSRLGFLTFCPTNLGTTIRASVLIKIPLLLAEKKTLDEISKKYNLQVRGTRGEHSTAEGGIVDVSNKRRLGLTEYDAVNEMYCGVCEIVKKEYQLANKK